MPPARPRRNWRRIRRWIAAITLVMVIIGAAKLMPPAAREIIPGKIKIVVSEEIPTAGMTLNDVPKLKELTFQRMKGMIESHS